MKELIKEIRNLKYRIKSCLMQKKEFEDPYKLSVSNLIQHVKGGESASVQEKRIEKLEALDDQLVKMRIKMDEMMNRLREFLVSNVEDYDCRLIVEQRLLYDKAWKEIETLRFMSVSAKQNAYYSQMKKLEKLEKEKC